MTKSKRVVIAMSGGVDSSVAAALLLQEGYDVIGLMLHLWSDDGIASDNRCCTPESMALARRVAAKLSIPFYVIDAQDIFLHKIVIFFINGYAHGITPNPCLACNQLIRWDFLLKHATALGAELFATGHYARVSVSDQNKFRLLQAKDQAKDQSYVLHILNQSQLSQTLFPLGEYTKDQVRLLAKEFNLPVADREESQDLCFLAGEDYRYFLKRHSNQVVNPGPIISTRGQILGEHQGLAFYTIGQRRRLGFAYHSPLYVVKKDISRNILIVGTKNELEADELEVGDINWISGEMPSSEFLAQIMIRYRAPFIWGKVRPSSPNTAYIKLNKPRADITPGQAAVFYQGEECLGGGIIKK